MTLQQAFGSFMLKDFEMEVKVNTVSSWHGGFVKHYVDLFEDGTYKTFDTHPVGNKYTPTGLVLEIPYLNNDDYDNGYFGNAKEEIKNRFSIALESVKKLEKLH